jgi:hypothetical protein
VKDEESLLMVIACILLSENDLNYISKQDSKCFNLSVQIFPNLCVFLLHEQSKIFK